MRVTCRWFPPERAQEGGCLASLSDGLTGLLFEPANAFDLAEKIGRLLDGPSLRNEMGLAGRRRFEEDFMWPDVIKRYWRPLLSRGWVRDRSDVRRDRIPTGSVSEEQVRSGRGSGLFGREMGN